MNLYEKIRNRRENFTCWSWICWKPIAVSFAKKADVIYCSYSKVYLAIT